MDDEVNDAWTALRTCLEARSRELSNDVRTYPTPIARCDEQLTKVIEDRDAAIRMVRMADEVETVRSGSTLSRGEWLVRLRTFADDIQKLNHEDVATACQRLVAALGR